MKKISIIIPIIQEKQTKLCRKFSATTITQTFSSIQQQLWSHAIDYEIILITDNATNITIDEAEIFPKYTQVKFYKIGNAKNLNDLIVRAIELSEFEYVGILGSRLEYLPKIHKKILSAIGNKYEVIAGLQSNNRMLPLLFGMQVKPHEGILFFKKSIWEVIKFHPSGNIVFSLEFLKRADEAGFSVKQELIPFSDQYKFSSAEISFKKIFGSVKNFVNYHLLSIAPVYVPSQSSQSMVNAGIYYKKQQYIIHTTLNAYNSALNAIDRKILFSMIILSIVFLSAFALQPLLFIQCFIAFLSSIYLIDVCFNMYLVLKTLNKTHELSFSKTELKRLSDNKLPVYSILCPLYKEVHILPQFIEGLELLDWPKEKLDVLILLESDDTESIELIDKMSLPKYIRTIVVPNSIPKTKPKACNYGLVFVKGDYTVIFDAEDVPDPQQLKKAYLGFKTSAENVVCLQAKLNYYNVHQNLLTRFFTIEYSLWFDITLTGLNSLNTVIPLGGTSNHFRTKYLKKLQAWDPFNVTEDADLGTRLFKSGYRTAILDSVTLEEGNSNVKNWIRQRSRWIKGYMQTYLVHSKETYAFFRNQGIHALIFHLVIGGKIAFIIINPILWIVTLLYVGLHPLFGAFIDQLYPPVVLYIAITAFIFGNYFYLFCHVMGCVKKGQWDLIKYVFFIPIYWILISIAGYMALYQLIIKPFYWEKTIHGLHLKNNISLTNAFSGISTADAQRLHS